MIQRRGLLAGLLAAPVIIRDAAALMPVKLFQTLPELVIYLHGEHIGKMGREVFMKRLAVDRLGPDGRVHIEIPYNTMPLMRVDARFVARVPFGGKIHTLEGQVRDDYSHDGRVQVGPNFRTDIDFSLRLTS